MVFKKQVITAKDGKTYILRRAEVADAAALLDVLRSTAEQTPFLLREPDEVAMTVEQEKDFIRGRIEAPRDAMLLVESENRVLGLCSLASMGSFRRYAHRCGLSIALHKDAWGLGLGRQMMKILLQTAKEFGYEQAELDVMADNRRAVALYESLGFERFGVMPRNMKYADGTYADAIWMMKQL